MLTQQVCPVCYGRGEIESTAVTLTCPDCRGSGLVLADHPGIPPTPQTAVLAALRPKGERDAQKD